MVSDAGSQSSDDRAERAGVAVLAVDVGNSRVHLGVVTGGKAVETALVGADELECLDEAIERLWARLTGAVKRVVVASSVAPKTLERVRSVVADRLGEEVLVIRNDLDLPAPVAVENPDQVGVDRVCAAAAAHAQLGQACVVADFGTAIKIDLISDDGVFMGGCILPGLRMSALALEEHTAALPVVDVAEPTHPWGRETQEAISNGIFFGAIGALREIVERYATELGRWPPLVVTGGGAETIARYADFVDHVVTDLTLRGIALAYHRACDRQDA